jgi:nucleoside-diphosphate-sugar epimerase
LNKLIITGVTGFIGSRFYEYVQHKHFPCIGISRGNKNIQYERVNYYDEVINYDSGHENIIHLAGSNNSQSIINIEDEHQIIKKLSHHFKNRLVYISSSKVYSNKLTKPILESGPTLSNNKYNKLKLLCENDVISNGGMVLRVSSVYGKGMSRDNVFNYISRQILEKKILINLKRPDDISDFININDLCSALYLACNNPISGIFNIGSSKGITIRNLCQLIGLEYGLNNLQIQEPTMTYQSSKIVLNCDLFNKHYKWKTLVSLELGIREWLKNTSMNYIKKHKHKVI